MLAAILASGLAVAAMLALTISALATVGIAKEAAEAAFKLSGRLPVSSAPPQGNVGRETRAAELSYRVAYLLHAARRLNRSLRQGSATGKTRVEALRQALRAERRYFGQSLQANRRRARAALQIDMTAKMFGIELGWYLNPVKSFHTPECLRAAGHNFSVAKRPRIGWPGMVHGQCACSAGPPFPGATSVDQATAGMSGD